MGSYCYCFFFSNNWTPIIQSCLRYAFTSLFHFQQMACQSVRPSVRSVGRSVARSRTRFLSVSLSCAGSFFPSFVSVFVDFARSFIVLVGFLLVHYLARLLISFFLPQENKLKVALLDYLRRQHPDDTDKFSMVAHHFSMYREIAQTLEETAVKQLASLGDCFPGT